MTLAEQIEKILYNYCHKFKSVDTCKTIANAIADKLVVDKKALEDIISDNNECGVMIYGISSLVNDIIKSKGLIKIKE